MIKFLFKKKEDNINEITQREFDYRISLNISQGVSCKHKENSLCTIIYPCPFNQEKQCNYDRSIWRSLRDKIMEYQKSFNEELKIYIEEKIEWLKKHRLESWKYFNNLYRTSKQKV